MEGTKKPAQAEPVEAGFLDHDSRKGAKGFFKRSNRTCKEKTALR